MPYRIPKDLTLEEGRAWLAKRRRKYRADNADRVKEGKEKWRRANMDKMREYGKAWREKPSGRATLLRWKLEHPDKVRAMKKAAVKRWAARNPEKAAEKRRRKKARYAERHPDKVRASQQRNTRVQRDRHPDRLAARKSLWLAVQRGDIVRQPCSVCGTVDAEAHHPDYSKPFDVVWLCPPHHRDEHRRLVAAASLLYVK